MSLSMYQASVPVLSRELGILSAILKKAEESATTRGIDPAVFINARLAPDMLPLSRQVQIVSDTAKRCAAALAGETPPSFADTETSFAELQERIAKTISYVQSVAADKIDGSEEREVMLKFPSGEMRFTGQQFLLHFSLPNLYFHVVAAYAILRHNGVAIGKMDYLGGV